MFWYLTPLLKFMFFHGIFYHLTYCLFYNFLFVSFSSIECKLHESTFKNSHTIKPIFFNTASLTPKTVPSNSAQLVFVE